MKTHYPSTWHKLVYGYVLQIFKDENCIGQSFIETGKTENQPQYGDMPTRHNYEYPDMVQPVATPEILKPFIKKHLEHILDFIEADARKLYENLHGQNKDIEQVPTKDLKKDHIYYDVRKIRDWIDNRK